MGGSAHRRRNTPPLILPSEDSTIAVTGGVVAADELGAPACVPPVDCDGAADALGVSVGDAEGAEEEVEGEEGSAVGAVLTAGSEPTLGA